MKLPRLNFTSHRDSKGYRIVGEVPPPRRRQSREELLNTPMDDLSFLAGRLGRVCADGTADGEWISGHIVGNGGKMKPVDLNQWPKAYEDFAELKTPEELVAFITKFGPLTYEKRQVAINLLDEARQMRECMAGKKGEPYSRTLTALLYKDRQTGELEIEVTPTSLLDALWLQFQHAQSSDAVFKTCPYCKKSFAAGGNSGRLRNAEFCSPEHRKRFNSLARSDPALRERRK